MYYVYLIQNEKGRIYLGSTRDLKLRLERHNAGMNASTRGHHWRVVYYEAYLTEQAMMQRERALKHHGKAYQALIARVKESLE